MLDPAFVARAIPPGSARHWSYVFAAPAAREALLGVYALLAEWQALLDPATERSVAQIKLAWWHEEMARLTAGNAVHPISRHLASLPHAVPGRFAPLVAALEAAMLELGGVPLEQGAQLQDHCDALLGGPLRVASVPASVDAASIARCTRALATAQYLARALRGYRRDAGCGRVPFPVDELLQAGIENADLTMPQPPPRLQSYLSKLRHLAEGCFDDAAQQLPVAARAPMRHLLVLAALGVRQLNRPDDHSAFAALKDMLLAWSTARRAAR